MMWEAARRGVHINVVVLQLNYLEIYLEVMEISMLLSIKEGSSHYRCSGNYHGS